MGGTLNDNVLRTFLFATSGQAIWFWMMLLTIVNLGAMLLRLLAPRLVPRSLSWLSQGILALTMLAFVSELLCDVLQPLRVLGQLAHTWLLMTAVVGLVLLQRADSRLRSVRHWQPSGSPFFLTTLSVLMLPCCSWRFQIHEQLEFRSCAIKGRVVPRWIAIHDVVAATDLGHEFPVFQFEVPAKGTMASAKILGSDIIEKIILVDDKRLSSNCHGRIFTNGQYIVGDQWVDMILKDNGYEVVEEPRIDDLIIYRNNEGVPVHTGLVKATGKDHFVLIESKWGGMPTYLHLPEDQVYSAHFSYYRRHRDSHQVKLVRRPTVPATFAASAK